MTERGITASSAANYGVSASTRKIAAVAKATARLATPVAAASPT
jgi:hypothetical protein